MGSQLSWYIARSGGLVSWWLLSATVVWGLLMSSRVLGPRAMPARLYDLHRFVSVLSLVFLGLHLAGLLTDRWVRLGVLEVLVPFTSQYRPVAVGWGVIAVYLLGAVQVTSLLRSRIPHRWWRWVHTTAFVLFALATVHALTAGTDRTLVRATALALVASIAFLAIYRLLVGRRNDGGISSARSGTAPPAQTARLRTQSMQIQAVQRVADGVVALDLADPDGAPLPGWAPGAHIDVCLPSGLIRQYSLCGEPAATGSYRIGVLHVTDGRGGSAEVHTLRAGDRIDIGGPRNNFPLVLAQEYLFVAGGIGITAIVPMVRAAESAGLPWRLVYGGRSRSAMAFADELVTFGGDRVRLVPADIAGLPDLAAAVSATSPETAIYACGPEPMLTALENLISTEFPDRPLHTERFGRGQPRVTAVGPDTEFTVKLRRSGQNLVVPADRSLLCVLRDAAPGAVSSSCEQGFCGSCETPVLDGVPDHRDTVLPPGQRDRRDVIYPCVSRARTATLTLDL
ncbi:ferric reductase-like transmembrane domain-containing protein [Nocardia puris]|uniref:2Fe-2S iron-sulfur cluster-binding protein n=1 Tax=Nocardia puris TaxID=208602 RepID=UPI00189369A0|nr:2Fe-2S iron-sulfur cluster-binding protein [Nocardia puris]MBF6215628.1 ferric reductase-like transmembrane domain-containing protein [Nocardia puris]